MKLILFTFNILFTLTLSSQNKIQFDQRLLQKYTVDYLERIYEENKNQFDFIEFFLNNSYYFQNIKQIPDQKQKYYPNILEYSNQNFQNIEIDDLSENSFNIFLFNIPFHQKEKITFSIGDLNKVIIIRSKNEIHELFKRHQLNK
ncbi:MAG: hypothetical protein CBE48_000385 [Flavobacteriales bacterium TMED288]|nr:hypothetical protein [Flavobacteriales bacterium]MAJ98485.1 hypothetical protein [Flavobacteriales bacterium]RPG53848.1 MAG: hypothetical protein CBE48_000385 [Flavobacteriales bacterium TMED288]|tara:strand:- start:2455 stop:2889 length:435 start_codon:yes stop_codon:yes gene_type:complete